MGPYGLCSECLCWDFSKPVSNLYAKFCVMKLNSLLEVERKRLLLEQTLFTADPPAVRKVESVGGYCRRLYWLILKTLSRWNR